MLREEVETYMAEIARVMRDDALCFITWFIKGELAKPSMSLAPFDDVSFVRKRRNPSAAVAYLPTFVRDLYTRNGLVPQIHYGTWARPQGLTFQDVVIADKRPL